VQIKVKGVKNFTQTVAAPGLQSVQAVCYNIDAREMASLMTDDGKAALKMAIGEFSKCDVCFFLFHLININEHSAHFIFFV
jgi:hypothetical protein